MKAGLAATAAAAFGLYPAVAFCAEAAEGGGSWLTFSFFAVNFAAFVAIVVFFSAPQVREFFRARASRIRETLERSESACEQARKLAEQAAARIAGLEAEKAALAAVMRAETEREAARVRELARGLAERIRRDAELTAAATGEAARMRIRAELAQVAADLARDLILRDFDQTDQSRLLEDFMGKLGAEARS